MVWGDVTHAALTSVSAGSSSANLHSASHTRQFASAKRNNVSGGKTLSLHHLVTKACGCTLSVHVHAAITNACRLIILMLIKSHAGAKRSYRQITSNCEHVISKCPSKRATEHHPSATSLGRASMIPHHPHWNCWMHSCGHVRVPLFLACHFMRDTNHLRQRTHATGFQARSRTHKHISRYHMSPGRRLVGQERRRGAFRDGIKLARLPDSATWPVVLLTHHWDDGPILTISWSHVSNRLRNLVGREGLTQGCSLS